MNTFVIIQFDFIFFYNLEVKGPSLSNYEAIQLL